MTEPFEPDSGWGFIYKLFAAEITEVASGVIEIRAVAREPRVCSKVAVYSRDPSIDCVRVCLGAQNRHIDEIGTSLGSERIDLIPWTNSADELIARALTPARVEHVALDHGKHQATITVTRDQLRIAVGRRGHNIELASRLCGWPLWVEVREDAA